MSRALFSEKEVRLATERRVKYIGAAKVSISQIQFEPPLPRDLNPKNLDRLRNVFRKNSCRRLDVNNHVPAVVSQQDLTNALRKANVTRQSLLTNDAHQLPRLAFMMGQLQGLHGRHRLQVGAEMLPPADRWWTVDLYMDDIGDDLRTTLVEEYANQKKPTDGEIYRKIRQYEGDYDESFRERWLVRLSRSNQDKLNQLDNRKNRRLRRAFDRLLNIPGLWPGGMRISVLHRLIASSCVEEIINYLEHVWGFWSSLVSSNRASMEKIDQDTVERLQLLAPGKCYSDAKAACGLVLSGQAFAEFSDEERRIIWARMQSFDGLIPSLYSFFEDFKYLESCAHCIKRLFGPSSSSVRETMSSMFIPCLEEGLLGSVAADCIIQTSEVTVRRQPGTDMERLETAYLQVWLYTMRHYPLMPPDPKKDGELLAKAARAKPDERVIYEMAELARQLGFRSKEIDAIVNSSPDYQIARSALLQARKPSRYRYDDQQFDLLVSRIVSCFAEAIPDQPHVSHDLLADSAMTLQVRSGMPQIRTHEQDSSLLFFDRMYADIAAADTITSFYVRRCVYFAFFGKPAWYASTNQAREANEDEGQVMGDQPRSPLFVQEDGPADVDESALHTAPVSESLQNGQQRWSTEHQRPPRSRTGREILQHRRRQDNQTRRTASHPTVERDREPMELELLRSEISDQDMLDQSNSPSEGHAPPALLNEPAPTEPAIAATNSRHESLDREGEDAMSDCTRVSFEAISLEPSPAERVTTEASDREEAFGDRTPIDHTARPIPGVSEAGEVLNIGEYDRNRGLDMFIADLRRAQEEEERLEEESASEWIDDELGLSSETHMLPDQPERSIQSENRQSPSPLPPLRDEEPTGESTESVHTDVEHPAAVAYTQELQSAPIPAERSEQTERRTSREAVEIQFWYFEREQWRRSDRLQVNPADTSSVERLADKYFRKNYSLYDFHLQDVRPAQCYQAAINEGRNAIFMISQYEEQKLIAEGRLAKDRQLVMMAAQALDRAEDTPLSPDCPVKHRKL
ncbi:hypothetical protein N7451_012792 [Penicillium sp. IBT 35674x]|nr:hypothetical protein N7451_012792 [Penicillium sp. IBT 35674x]